MKKICLIILTMFFINHVMAADIKSISITGSNKVTIGSELVLNFQINHSDLKKGTDDSYGIISLAFEVEFDDKIFSIIDAKSNDFDISTLKNDDKYYIVAAVKSNESLKNKCVDKKLHCGDFKTEVTFYARETSETNTNISMTNVESILLKVNGDYDLDNALYIESYLSKTHEVTIEKTSAEIKTEPKSITVDKELNKLISELDKKIAGSTDNKTDTKEVEVETAYLKKLKIKGHRINFSKDILEYNIYVDNETNSLEITATPESSTSEVVITGNEDLKSNNNEVKIEVLSKKGEKKTYTIFAKIKPKSEIIEEETPKKEFDKKYLYIGAGILGVLMIFLIIYLFINHKENKKLKKMLDEFDKF